MQDPLPIEIFNYEIVSYHLNIQRFQKIIDSINKQATKELSYLD